MTARVPLVDLQAQHGALAREIEAAVSEVLRSGRFVLGPSVERFEREAADFLGVRHAIGVSSGTDALIVALTALGVGPGDEVLTTPFTFFATVEGILRVGATPRFVDVEPETLNLDAERVDAVLSPDTKAIVPVHLYGAPVPMGRLTEIAARHGVPIVEDAAQAFGARVENGRAGALGALGCFSFFPAKVLGAVGDAGLVVTNDEALASACRRLRQHGSERRGEHVDIGGNFRMDAIQAAVLSAKIRHVESWIGARREHARVYDNAFGSITGLTPLVRGPGWNGAVYTVRVWDGRRDALRAHLGDSGIETAVYYDRPVHLQPALAGLGLQPGSFPESERAATEVLSLPIYAEMTAEQRDLVIGAVREFFRSFC